MGRREPHMEWNYASFHSKSDEKQRKNSGFLAIRKLRGQQMEAGEIQAAGGGGQDQKRDQHQPSTGMGHDQEQNSGLTRFFFGMFEAAQSMGGKRHHLPGDQEEEHI